MHALTLGFGLGFIVALQLGPMSLFLVRSTLAGGWYAGLAVGAGIALVDAAYAAAGAAGAAPLLAIGPLETLFGVLGAAVILWLGVRTLRSARTRRDADAGGRAATTPRRAFLTSLAATSANPATIVSWAAVFAAAGAAGAANTAGGAALLVAGVGLGSLAWVSMLATGTAGAGRALGPGAIRAADVIAGAGLLAFGVALAVHSVAAA
jgi:putative LysE/RhtB family amino acid efflux pump